jgi:uncharacterized protein DUF3472
MVFKKRNKFVTKPKLAILGFVLVFAAAGITYQVITHAADIAPAGTYVYVNMPTGNLTNISHDLTINNVPNLGSATYFWSKQFYFMSGPSGQGGYIGLQGIDKAVFSIFDYASTEASPICDVVQSGFDGGVYDEPGTSCIIDYPVVQGDSYRLQVTDIGQDSQGINWQGSVENLTTGQTTVIATVNVAASWGDLTGSFIVWTEDFGAAITSCSDLPFSDVTFSNFTADNGQYTMPASHSEQIAQNDCTSYSQITDNNANSFTEEMGITWPSNPQSYVDVSADKGSLSAGATLQPDSSASDGQHVQFGTP